MQALDFKCHLFFLDYTIVSFIIQNVHLRYSKKSLYLNSNIYFASSPHLEAVLQFFLYILGDGFYM